ncbi:MAG: hypothetical protein ACRCV9_19080 [Burkholderiaceae bacterium]
MPVTEQTPVSRHVGNGITVAFAWDWLLFSTDDLVVTVDNIVKNFGIDFSVSGLGDPSGGVVTFFVPPGAGLSVVISRDTVLERDTDYQNSGDLLAKTIDRDFDRIWTALQDRLSDSSRSLRVPAGETLPLLPNAAARANTIQAYDSSGNPVVTVPISGSAADVLIQLSNASNVSQGDAQIAARFTRYPNTLPTNQHQVNLRSVSFFEWLTKAQQDDYLAGTATLDLATPLANARNDIAADSSGIRTQLRFPAGRLRTSVSPNWAVQRIQLVAEGELRWRYTGGGDALIADAGAVSGKVSNIDLFSSGGLIIEAPATARNGMFIRSILRSRFGGRVVGCGTTFAAVRLEGAVLCAFYDLTVTNDEDGAFYLGAKPQNGLYLTQRGAGEQSSYNSFFNCNVQSCTDGIFLDASLGNCFFGGDSEFNTGRGLILGSAAVNNRFYGMDLEVNGTSLPVNQKWDFECFGSYNEFHGIDSNTEVVFRSGAKGNKVFGGVYDDIVVDSGALGTLLQGCGFNRSLSGGTITNNDPSTAFRNVYRMNDDRYDMHPRTISTAVTFTGSPFTYTNTSNNTQEAVVVSGTVSLIERGRDGTFVGVGTGIVQGNFTLRPGDQLRITYSAVPTLIIFN